MSKKKDVDIIELREAAKTAIAFYNEEHGFHRNEKLSHVVHALINAAQLLAATSDEVFHNVHQAMNKAMRVQDPTIPALPEERNPVSYLYPVCMSISFTLGYLSLFTEFLQRNTVIAMIANAVGGTLMLIAGIFAMRQAEKHINLNEVSDENLIKHPIFIHNIVLCMFSVFGMSLYLIQGWILYDLWRWRLQQTPKSISLKSEATEKTESDESGASETPVKSLSALTFDHLPSRHKISHQDPEMEPVILFCCCVDCVNYIKESFFTNKPNHEFQVVHVM